MTVAVDPTMPWLADALNVRLAEMTLRHAAILDGMDAHSIKVRSARITRHRPGRRCLIEYRLEASIAGSRHVLALLGKIRTKGLDHETLRVVAALRDAGFSADSEDGISVPEPAGVIPEWQMVLSLKVGGSMMSEYLGGAARTRYAERVGDVARKIHESGVAGRKSHSMADELAVLDAALLRAADATPPLATRIGDVGAACREIAGESVPRRVAGIHRDFYADQIIVSDGRLYVLDLDQFCNGDPALDIGNFLAHITEQSIRMHGHPSALDDARHGLLEQAVRNGGERETILVYDLLTLARQLWISTRIPDRNHSTAIILAECERRLQRHPVEPC